MKPTCFVWVPLSIILDDSLSIIMNSSTYHTKILSPSLSQCLSHHSLISHKYNHNTDEIPTQRPHNSPPQLIIALRSPLSNNVSSTSWSHLIPIGLTQPNRKGILYFPFCFSQQNNIIYWNIILVLQIYSIIVHLFFHRNPMFLPQTTSHHTITCTPNPDTHCRGSHPLASLDQ